MHGGRRRKKKENCIDWTGPFFHLHEQAIRSCTTSMEKGVKKPSLLRAYAHAYDRTYLRKKEEMQKRETEKKGF